MKKNNSAATTHRIAIGWVGLLVCLCSLLTTTAITIFPADAGANSGLPDLPRYTSAAAGGPRYSHGWVATLGLVQGDNDKPIYVEYDKDGRVARVIGEAVDELENATVMAGPVYSGWLQSYQRLRNAERRNIEVLPRNIYEGRSFTTAGDDPQPVPKPALQGSTQSVVVRAERALLTPSTELLLLESPIDLTSAVPIEADIVSVIIGENGQLLRSGRNRIGFQATYLEEKESASDDDVLLGPIVGADVTLAVNSSYPGRTNERGFYGTGWYMPPCPGFFMAYNYEVSAELAYRNFNPKSESGFETVFATYPAFDACFGIGFGVSLLGGAQGVEGKSAQAISEHGNALVLANTSGPKNIIVSSRVFSGQGALVNEVPYRIGTIVDEQVTGPVLVGETQRSYQIADFTKKLPAELGLSLDLNGDGEVDYSAWADDEKTQIAVYFDGPPADSDTAPDILRQPDSLNNFQDQGLVKQISESDLGKTDIYIFRKSNGELINALENIGSDDTAGAVPHGGGPDVTSGYGEFFYHSILLPGKEFVREAQFDTWQQTKPVKNDLWGYRKDRVRDGETLTLVAINRPTGYIGNVDFIFGDTANDQYSMDIPAVVLRPPNLKIRAERLFVASKGIGVESEKTLEQNLIGFEGSALTSDTVLAIKTEWYDHNGNQLPEGLPGFTGRLAKTTKSGLLVGHGGSNSDSVGLFTIKPGTNTEVIELPDGSNLGNENFYVHAVGEPRTGVPDFSTIGAGEGALATRPRYAVPLLVPIFDQQETLNQLLAFRQNASQTPELELLDPFTEDDLKPVYRWVYRPEMQVSLFDFDVTRETLFENDPADEGDDSEGDDANNKRAPIALVDILGDEATSIVTSDEFLQVLLYSLTGNDILPLERFGANRELILSLDEQEVAITVGPDGSTTIKDPEQLTYLDSLDFLTISLYQNDDAANILWQFSSESLVLEPVFIDDSTYENGDYVVTADSPSMELEARLTGFALRDENDTSPFALRWEIKGDGQLAAGLVTFGSKTGRSVNTLIMPPMTDAEATVTVSLVGKPELTSTFGVVRVVPGEPASIEVTYPGSVANAPTVSINEVVKAPVVALVKDAHGNKVSDGTGVRMSASGDAKVDVNSWSTVDGLVDAELVGGYYPSGSENNELTLQAGDVIERQNFAVQPFDVVVTVPNEIFVNTIIPISVTATDPTGAIVTDVPVSLFAKGGRISKQGIPQPDGSTIYNMHTGFVPLNQDLSVKVGGSATVTVPVNVLPVAGENTLNTGEALLIGDLNETASEEIELSSGATQEIQYDAETLVTVMGDPGDVIPVTLGSLSEPVIAPLFYYNMNAVDSVSGGVPEATELHPAGSQYLTIVNDHPWGIGESFEFSPQAFTNEIGVEFASRMDVPSNQATLTPQSLGFRVAIKPTEFGGTIFNHEQGTQTLTLAPSGELIYTARTGVGEFSVSASPDHMEAGRWHIVAGRLINGRLELEVDGHLALNENVSGSLSYPTAPNGTEIGNGFTGRMTDFALFDWQSDPLVTFEDGSLVKNVVIPDHGATAVAVKSTGKLNAQQPGSALQMAAVGIYAASNEQFISLVSKQMFSDMSLSLAEVFHLAQNPTVSSGGSAANTVLQMLGIGTAHAFFRCGDLCSIVKDIFSYGVPWREALVLGEQVWYFISGNDDFDVAELAMAAVGTLTFLPVLKPLKPLLDRVVRPLHKFMRRYGHLPVVKSFAGTFGKGAQELFSSGKVDTIIVLLPLVITVGEMVVSEDDAIQEALLQLSGMIDGDEDFAAWMGFLYLPVKWALQDEGLGDEELAMSSNYMPYIADVHIESSAPSLLSWLVPEAQANRKRNITYQIRALKRAFTKRKSAGEVAEIIKAASTAGAKHGLSGREISAALKAARSVLTKAVYKNGAFASARVAAAARLAFNPKTITAIMALASRAGVKEVRGLIYGHENQRVSLAEIIAIIGYLESQRDSLPEKVRKEINTLYRTAFVDLTAGIDERVCHIESPHNDITPGDPDEEAKAKVKKEQKKTLGLNRANGALYHLSQIASLLLEGHIIVDVEKVVEVPIRSKPGGDIEIVGEKKRKVDIVAKGSQASKEIWVEVKSMGRNSGSGKVNNNAYIKSLKRDAKFNPRNKVEATLDSDKENSGGIPRIEFWLDRAGTYWVNKDIKDGTQLKVDGQFAEKIHWRFQDFRLDDVKSNNRKKQKKPTSKEECSTEGVQGLQDVLDDARNGVRTLLLDAPGVVKGDEYARGSFKKVNARIVEALYKGPMKKIVIARKALDLEEIAKKNASSAILEFLPE